MPSPYRPAGIPPGHSAPLPIVHAGKLYTTPTVLSSGEALKKNEFCIDFVQFRALLASPSAPGISPSFPADCLLPTAYCRLPLPLLLPQASSPKPQESCAPFCSRRPRPLACPGLPVGPPRARATARGFALLSSPRSQCALRFFCFPPFSHFSFNLQSTFDIRQCPKSPASSLKTPLDAAHPPHPGPPHCAGIGPALQA